MKVTVSKIPDFLKLSKLYESLSELDNEEPFDIQDEFFKEEIIIKNYKDLITYIKMFDYWIIKTIPNNFYKCMLKIKDEIDIDLLNEEFPMNDLVIEIKTIIKMPWSKLNSYFSLIGNLELLKFSYENSCLWTDKYSKYAWFGDETCENAALNGHLDCLKYAHENDYEWNRWTCNNAIKNGHLECLKYAHKNKCPFDYYLSSILAAQYGQLECLKYVHENGCEMYEETCMYAALNGHLEILKYAHEHGCPWDKYTCEWAVKNGQLECLKYAHENGCKWSKNDLCIVATENNHIDCLHYIYEN